jgi:Fibronectin type III domain
MLKKLCLVSFLLWISAVPQKLQALDSFTLNCIADAPMYGYSSEADLNWGVSTYMRIKDYQGIPFMQFDFDFLRGMKVVSCTLFVYSVTSFAFETDIISTIMVPWYEGTKNGQAEVGASCYNYRVYPDSLWAGMDSDARSVINGDMGSLVNSTNLSFPEGGGWSEVVLDLEPAQQLVDGEAYGIALFGREIQYNRDITSRETGSGPYIEIKVEEGEKTPPAKISDLAVEKAEEHGKFTISWTAPGDDGDEGTAAAYELRYSENAISDDAAWENATLLPGTQTPDTAGTLQRQTVTTLTPGAGYHLALRARDEAWNWSELSNDLTVSVPLDQTPPGMISDLRAVPGNGNGEVVLSWTAPGDDGSQGTASGYELRYSSGPVDESNWEQADSFTVLIFPGEGGSTQSYVVTGLYPDETYYFALRAFDEVPLAGTVSNSPSATASIAEYNLWAVPPYYKINPRTGNAFEYDPNNYDTDGAPAPYKAFNSVWDASESKVSLLAGRNEFAGFQVVIENAGGETLRDMDVSLSRLSGPMALDMKFTKLYREWYHRFGDVMYPDLLVPFETDGGVYQVNPFTIPDSTMRASMFGSTIPQNNQAIFVDLYIPHDAAPGTYNATLRVKGRGVNSKEINVEVEVLNFELSDEVHYGIEFNCYSDPVPLGWRVSNSTATAALHDSLERVVQRMLHEHRIYLDIMPYSQSPTGTASFRHAPELSGSGADLTISDWTGYDTRFDPYFSGSAFEGNPRSGVPVPFYYLPFHTTWPVPSTGGQKIDSRAFEDQDYIDGWTKIVTEFEAHINRMGWNRTRFFCYQNEKEQYGNAWDLDEPTTQEHYAALNFYAGMFHNGLKRDGEAGMIYRCDMGHFSYLSGELDDAVDIWVINRGDYPENKVRQRQAAGDMAWTYGAAPYIYHNMENNYLPYFTNWGRGARGFCYWNTFAAWGPTDNAWTRNHQGDTNLFYPGHAGATNMVGHLACPSLRMKVIRDIIEVMEALQVMAGSSSYTVEQSEAVARQYNTGKLESYVRAEEEIKRMIDGIGGPAPEPPVTEKTCDFSGDGKIDIADVITMLMLARDDPDNPDLDWNGDSSYTISDAVGLLLDIIKGTCPDNPALLAGVADPLTSGGIPGLSAGDIEYLEETIKEMNLGPEQAEALKNALYGGSSVMDLPGSFSLQQNTPNPFNPSTTISYTVAGGGSVRVRLEVFDLRGAVVRVLVDERREPGTYHTFWDGTDNSGTTVGSGVYFYRLRAGDFVKTRKMVLLK